MNHRNRSFLLMPDGPCYACQPGSPCSVCSNVHGIAAWRIAEYEARMVDLTAAVRNFNAHNARHAGRVSP